MNELKNKKIEQRVEEDILTQLNSNLYALAGYLAEFAALIRRSAPRPGAR